MRVVKEPKISLDLDVDHKKIIEAALFVSDKPLQLNELAKLTGINSLGFVKDLLEKVQKGYEGSGLEIVSTAEGWSMQVKGELLSRVAHLAPYSDIPEGCKRTLALIAYKEPVKQSDIIKMQGNKVYAYIKFLHNKGLITGERYGRTKILKVTKEFERYFGMEKEKIKEVIGSQLQGQV